jgi:hypothetical protein
MFQYGYADRPIWRVDFSKYNLFKPQNEQDAYTLHKYLRFLDGAFGSEQQIDQQRIDDIRQRANANSWSHDIDDLDNTILTDDGRNFDNAVEIVRDARELMGDSFADVLKEAEAWDGNQFTEDMDDFDLAEYPEVINAIEAVLEEDGYGYNSKSFFDNKDRVDTMYELEAEVARMMGMDPAEIRELARQSAAEMEDDRTMTDDSRATRFMKELGWEGVDTRHLKGFDNTTYGSVIYDLKGDDLKQKQANNPRFSLPSNKDYKAAVDAGDMKAAQRMVNEVAEKAFSKSKIRDEDGKLRDVYHGTNDGSFTVFDDSYIGSSSGDDGFFGR